MKKTLRYLLTLCLSLVIAVTAAAPVSAAWAKDQSGRWIYTTASGRSYGWQKIDNAWYYFNGSGVMQTGWRKIDNIWYYLRPNGVMATGWQLIDNVWYYFSGSGAMKTGWLLNGGKWYYFSGSGAMATGWVRTGGKWYLMDDSGAMRTGWASVGGKRYYLDSSGAMVTGTVIISGETCNFSEDGVLSYATPPAASTQQNILRQVNDLRQQEGLAPLVFSQKLSLAAYQRAAELASTGSIFHYRPDGSQWWTVLSEYGVSNLDGSAENLASGMDTADAAVKAWMESASHKEAILGNYSYTGIGFFTKNDVTCWVQLFSGSETAKD